MKPHEAMRFARKKAKLTQEEVGQLFGISREAVSQWESADGTRPDFDKLPVLAKAYGVSIDELLGGPSASPTAGNTEEASAPRYKLPLISWVSAGRRDEANDPYAVGNAESWLDFEGPCSSVSFALRVRGDSMMSQDGSEPTFPDGCIIGVDPRRKVKSQDFAVFRFDDVNEATFKRFVLDGPAQLLMPLNPRYPPLRVTPDARCVGAVFEKIIKVGY